jgi:hypothetical protein
MNWNWSMSMNLPLVRLTLQAAWRYVVQYIPLFIANVGMTGVSSEL